MESDFQIVIDRLINRVQHWTPTRWAKPALRGAGSHADLIHRLAQRLADAGAEIERRATRPVPRLDNDLALPDQVSVLAHDVVAASPPDDVLVELAAEVRRVAADLS